MPDLQVSADIDALLSAADNAAARQALQARGNVVQTWDMAANATWNAPATVLIVSPSSGTARSITLPPADSYANGARLEVVCTTGFAPTITYNRSGLDNIVCNGVNLTSFARQARSPLTFTKIPGAWAPSAAVAFDGSPEVADFVVGQRLTIGEMSMGTNTGAGGYNHSVSFGSGRWLTREGNSVLAFRPGRIGFQPTTSGTPTSGYAELVAFDVGGTTELHAVDSAGNITRISNHTHTAPAWMYPDGPSAAAPISTEWNIYTGVVTYQHRLTGQSYKETFEEHNARLELAGDRALTILTWSEVQSAHAAMREDERTQWQADRNVWEALPSEERPPWTLGEQPEPYEPVPQPPGLTDQRATVLAGRARQAAREALRTQFLAEQDVFLGPFFSVLMSVTPLLDSGRDTAAELAIRAAVAPSFFTEAEKLTFATKRDEYADLVASLPQV